MAPQGVPSRIQHPVPLPSHRRAVLTSDTFWSLMNRWKVANDRALSLIGYRHRGDRSERPRFMLSDQQAEVLSCLLEIDLTLTVAGIRVECLHQNNATWSMAARTPLDALGECDAMRATAVLWLLNQGARRGTSDAKAAAR